MSQPVAPHVRYCHGCDNYDDHPRARVIDPTGVEADRIYHYDCLPVQYTENNDTIAAILDARADGAKGDALREAAVKHAQTISEAPADSQEG